MSTPRLAERARAADAAALVAERRGALRSHAPPAPAAPAPPPLYIAPSVPFFFHPLSLPPQAQRAWAHWGADAFAAVLCLHGRVGGPVARLPAVLSFAREWGLLGDVTESVVLRNFTTQGAIGAAYQLFIAAHARGEPLFYAGASGSLARAWWRVRAAAGAPRAELFDARAAELARGVVSPAAAARDTGWNIVDSFAGVGSASVAVETLERDGARVVAAFEKEKSCAELYGALTRGVPLSVRALEEVPEATLAAIAARGRIVHWFSPPCQDHSPDSAHGAGAESEEARAAIDALRRVALLCPAEAVIVENVAGFLRVRGAGKRRRRGDNAGTGFDMLVGALHVEYPLHVFFVRDSALRGAGQHRERVCGIFWPRRRLRAARAFVPPPDVLPRRGAAPLSRFTPPWGACAELLTAPPWNATAGGGWGGGLGSGAPAVVESVRDIVVPAAAVPRSCWLKANSWEVRVADAPARDGLAGMTPLADGALVGDNFWRLRDSVGGGTFYGGDKDGSREDICSTIEFSSSLYIRARDVDGTARVRAMAPQEALRLFRFPRDREVSPELVETLGAKKIVGRLGNGTVVGTWARAYARVRRGWRGGERRGGPCARAHPASPHIPHLRLPHQI
jgi:hypothetical protein